MSKTISLTLSSDSIRKAIKAVQEYKETIRFKTSDFVQRLASLGIATIDTHKHTEGDSDADSLETGVKVTEEGSKVKAVLTLEGKDVLFIEFGAGVHYNGEGGSSPHPRGQDLGYTIGSYGKGHGLEDSWWYFDEEQGQFVESHGTRAAMPMYEAYNEIIRSFVSVGKEVFGS